MLDFKARFLELLAMSLGKNRETLKIYDPFFCQGSVVQHLQHLGTSQKQFTYITLSPRFPQRLQPAGRLLCQGISLSSIDITTRIQLELLRIH